VSAASPSVQSGTRISGPSDVARALVLVRDRLAGRAVTADLRQPITTAVEPAFHDALPVHGHLASLLHAGLPCGATIELRGGQGASSLLIATISQASAAGHWTAIVGQPDLNPIAVAEAGADLAKVALVRHPEAHWADVVAALCDGLALVATAIPAGLSERRARALAARARRSGCVLIPFGGHWPAADLTIESTQRRWHTRPNGRLPRCFDLDVTVRGRGAATRPRRQAIHLPAGTADQHCPLPPSPQLQLVT